MKYIFDVYRHRSLLWNFVVRDLRGRYVGSAMGFFWNIINPLILVAVYTFVFSYVLKGRPPESSGTDVFAIYLFCGLLPWLAFSEALGRNVTTILDNSMLVSKVRFPVEILVIYIVLSSLIHELLALSILLVMLVFTGTFPGAKVLYFVPVVLLGQVMFTLGLSFIFSSMNVFVRDVAHLLGALLMVWFFATPIIYPLEVVPESVRGLMGLNPLTQLVEIYRAVLIGNRFHTLTGTAYFFGVSVVVFAAGSWFFNMTKKEFPDLI